LCLVLCTSPAAELVPILQDRSLALAAVRVA